MRWLSRRQVLGLLWAGLVAVVLASALRVTLQVRRHHRYDKYIRAVSLQNGVDPDLVRAVIWRESRFNPHCVGRAGEVGLMQVTELAAQEWAEANGIQQLTRRNLANPYVNIRAGTWYLARALRYWSNRPDPIPFALAEYNAGRSNALRWARRARSSEAEHFVRAITYPSTRQYIRDILIRYRGKV